MMIILVETHGCSSPPDKAAETEKKKNSAVFSAFCKKQNLQTACGNDMHVWNLQLFLRNLMRASLFWRYDNILKLRLWLLGNRLPRFSSTFIAILLPAIKGYLDNQSANSSQRCRMVAAMKDYMSPWLAVYLTLQRSGPTESHKSGSVINMAKEGLYMCSAKRRRGCLCLFHLSTYIIVHLHYKFKVVEIEQKLFVSLFLIPSSGVLYMRRWAWLGQLPKRGITERRHDLRASGPKPTHRLQGQCVSAILEQRGHSVAVLVNSPPPPLFSTASGVQAV